MYTAAKTSRFFYALLNFLPTTYWNKEIQKRKAYLKFFLSLYNQDTKVLKVSASRKNAFTIYLGHTKAKIITPFKILLQKLPSLIAGIFGFSPPLFCKVFKICNLLQFSSIPFVQELHTSSTQSLAKEPLTWQAVRTAFWKAFFENIYFSAELHTRHML